ncbi:MAG: hypothetical protein KCHDKBKB_01734 [Elusimicrobia bacterium]|nr:hypothetical protein [Elusimicrobiota bacterium]
MNHYKFSRETKDIDFLFTDEETLKAVIRDGQEITISGEPFIVPSLDHLIAMKLHAIKQNPERRELKDLLDIAALIKENNIDIESDSFRNLCLQYGSQKSYEKLR